MFNGGLDTGQIDHILPICSTIGINETKWAHLNSIKLYSEMSRCPPHYKHIMSTGL